MKLDVNFSTEDLRGEVCDEAVEETALVQPISIEALVNAIRVESGSLALVDSVFVDVPHKLNFLLYVFVIKASSSKSRSENE